MDYKDFEQEYYLEAYFSNIPKPIFKAEKALQDIIDRLLKESITDKNMDFFRDKLEIMCNSLCDQFGFYYKSDIVLSSECGPASIRWTMPTGFFAQDNLASVRKVVSIDMNKGTFKFNDKYQPWVDIYLNTNFLRKCKDAKLGMATILHEIGHTFEKQFRMVMHREETVESIYQTLSRFNLLGAERKRLLLTSNVLYNIFGKVYVGLKDRVWKKETFADQFASMFGYGSFIPQVLKITEDRLNDFRSGQTTSRIEDLNFFDKALFELKIFINTLSDAKTHPDFGERAADVITYLEYELKHNKTLKPSDKKKIQEDIKKIEKTIEQYLEDDDDNYIVNRAKSDIKKSFDKQRAATNNNQVRGVDYYLDK